MDRVERLWACILCVLTTLRATKLQEHHGRTLQLNSGTLMVVLALAMVLRPSTLESLAGTSAVFGAAAAIVAVVLITQRWVPRRSMPHLPHSGGPRTAPTEHPYAGGVSRSFI